MIEDIKTGANLIELFSQNKITEYCFRQELGNLLGEGSEVQIYSEASQTTSTTFAVFVVPEKRVNGIILTYFIDKAAFNFYEPEELAERLLKIASVRQNIIREFLTFTRDNANFVVTFGKALACLLRINQGMLEYLKVDDKNFLPSSGELGQIINDLEDGKADSRIIETLAVKNFAPKGIEAFAKKMVHDYPDSVLTTISLSNDEKPTQNLFRQEIRQYCPNANDKMHMDIPYNYKPSTNQ